MLLCVLRQILIKFHVVPFKSHLFKEKRNYPNHTLLNESLASSVFYYFIVTIIILLENSYGNIDSYILKVFGLLKYARII